MAKEFKPIMVDEELKAKIEYLAKKIGCSQTRLLAELVSPIYETSVNVRGHKCWFESYTDARKGEVLTQWFGSANLIVQEIRDPECLGDKVNEVLDEKAMQNDINARLLGDIGIRKSHKSVKVSGKVKKK